MGTPVQSCHRDGPPEVRVAAPTTPCGPRRQPDQVPQRGAWGPDRGAPLQPGKLFDDDLTFNPDRECA